MAITVLAKIIINQSKVVIPATVRKDVLRLLKFIFRIPSYNKYR